MKRFHFLLALKPVIFLLALPVISGLLWVSCGKSGGAGSATKTDTTATTTIKYIDTLPDNTPMTHPGGLQVAEDFVRMKANLTTEPWLSGWNKLIANSHAQLSYSPNPTVKLIRGGSSAEEPDPDNYWNAYNDVAAAYQTAIRWKVTGDTNYANKSIQILNAWAATCIGIYGDPNSALAAGIYGFQFAVAGELMRDYSGWKPADFQAYQQWMLKVFYSYNQSFLIGHQNSCPEHYWSNWDLCNLASAMAIGILTDQRVIYNYVVNYLQHSSNGNGNIQKAINYVFTGTDAGLAQLQESGRDQGHATLVIALLGPICEMAYHQGDDFYGFNDNMLLKACEYTAKYNVALLDVPFHSFEYYTCVWYPTLTPNPITQIGSDSRGAIRPMYALPYNHYAKLKGLSAPYTLMGVNQSQPEGGGGDYGPNSGGFDQLGFGTLLYSR
ncbi:MAG TPA: alginate lyase family protein [Puia sp.]|nr:alginate lyase family protein [Puia sp.]